MSPDQIFTKSSIKHSVEKGLDAVINCLTDIKEKIEEEPVAKPKMKYGQVVLPEIDEHIDSVKQALERNLKR